MSLIGITDACKDLIRRLLCDEDDRLGTYGGAAEIQAHPFFDGIVWSELRNQRAPIIPVVTSPTGTTPLGEETRCFPAR